MNTKIINIENILRPILLLGIGLTIGLIIGIAIAGSNIAPRSDKLRGVGELNQLTARRVVNPRADELLVPVERLARAESHEVAPLGRMELKVEDVDALDVLDSRLNV